MKSTKYRGIHNIGRACSSAPPPSRRCGHRDGLQGSAKLLLDALCAPGKPDKRGRVRHRGGLGVLVDDGAVHVVDLEVIAARGRNRTDVLIEEVP